MSLFLAILHFIPFIETHNTEIGPHIIQNVENNVVDASDTLVHTSSNHPVDSNTITQPSNDVLRVESIVTSRPSRSHKLLIYLHDFIIPKTINKNKT